MNNLKMGCDAFTWFWQDKNVLSQSPLIAYISKSLCILKIKNQIYYGFFIKFSEKNFDIMTVNNATIEEMINKKETLFICYDNDKKISLDLNDKERTIKNIKENNTNIILIEILPKDKIGENYFLAPNIKYSNNNYEELKNLEITIIVNFGLANGKIEKIIGNEFTFKLDRTLINTSEEKISSGNPIFLKNSKEVIGITKESIKEGLEYYADFIGFITETKEEKKERKEQKKMELEDGGYYIGESNKEDIPNGKGKYFFKNGEIYEGEIINDKFEGNGKYIYSSGEYYIGQWKNNLRNGKGILYYKNNNIKYEGDFVKDKFEGNGKYIWENGEYYIGQFKNDLNNGKGKIYYKNGNIEYEGDFVEDKFEGNGKYVYEDEQYYIGEFKNGYKNGKGIMYYKNGDIEYDGNFLEGKFDGEGKYVYENGDYYIGHFKNGLCHGKGKEYDKNGKLLSEGLWINDEKA